MENSLRRDLPIITTPHAKSHLTKKPEEKEAFTAVYDLDTFTSMVAYLRPTAGESFMASQRTRALKVTAMPGKHVPPGVLGTLNDIVGAVCITIVNKYAGADVLRFRQVTDGFSNWDLALKEATILSSAAIAFISQATRLW